MLKRHTPDREITFSAEAEQRLLAYRWQGNVRELENCVHRAAIMAAGNRIAAADVYFEDAIAPAADQCAAAPDQQDRLLDGGLRDREKQLIVNALEKVEGSRKDAASLLGISPRTLRYKLARLKEQGVPIPAAG